MNRCCITLLTDFGLQDSYVGQMKGVIAAINPEAIVIDISHAVRPQDVRHAALVLADAIDAFPPGTIHVAVIDPGVGSPRRAIAAQIGHYRFVAPDNGLLTLVLNRYGVQKAVVLDQPRWWRRNVSRTFHGRDLFAPTAAHWSNGCRLEDLGSPLSIPLVQLDLRTPATTREESGRLMLQGTVLAVDHFGNLITNLTRSQIPAQAQQITIRICARTIHGLNQFYAEKSAGELVALVGSSERLEVAIVNGSAAKQLGADVGEGLIATWEEPSP